MSSKINTIHHSRTIMFDEMERIIETGKNDNNFIQAIDNNAIGKKSKTALRNAKTKLLGIYSFDMQDPSFQLFLKFWEDADENERRLMTFLLALKEDMLLEYSIDFIIPISLQQEVSKEALVKHISKFVDYTDNTLKSSSRNIISSWKQAGFIKGGGRKRIRTQPTVTYAVVAFAVALGIIDGLEGEYLLKSSYIKALDLSNNQLNELLNEAKVRDLIKYQNIGGVVSIGLKNKLTANVQ